MSARYEFKTKQKRIRYHVEAREYTGDTPSQRSSTIFPCGLVAAPNSVHAMDMIQRKKPNQPVWMP